MFNTIKAAREAGYRERKVWEYGGEEIGLKGRLLVRTPKEALSQTEWSRRGYRVPQDADAHCRRSVHFTGTGRITYPVYREDQVEPKRRAVSTPPVLIEVLVALWAINRRAKRCRDLASTHYRSGTHGFAAAVKKEKQKLYALKGQSLHHLLMEGRLEIVGHHRFSSRNWSEVVEGGGYTFHRPCPEQHGEAVKEIGRIEAKPRGRKEPRLKDAVFTVEAYLNGKPVVGVFEWPQKALARPPRQVRRRNDRFGGDGGCGDEDSAEEFEAGEYDDWG